MDATFERAFKQTRWDLWQWRKIIWNDEMDALQQLVVAEVWSDVGRDITADLPDQPKLRKVAMKVVHRSIAGIGTPLVKTAYTGSKEAVNKIKDPVKKTL